MSQTVLVADDSRTIRKVVEMALKAQPFEVIGVGSAREAMEAAERRPSIIILDYYMPDGSGYDVCRALKANQSTSNIPVLMLGGTYKDFDPALARDSGATGVLMKPFKTDDLLSAITAAISSAPRSAAAPRPPTSPAAPPPRPPVTPASLSQPPRNVPTPAPRSAVDVSASSQPRIPMSSSQPRINPSEAAAANARHRTPTPVSGLSSPGFTATSGSGVSPLPMNRAELENLIREEVKKTVREELPGLLRNVMGEVFQQKVLPRLLKHSDERIQTTLREELDERIKQQVRQELERLLSEE